jgi:hypothetical protein
MSEALQRSAMSYADWTQWPTAFIADRRKKARYAQATIGALLIGWLLCNAGLWIFVVAVPAAGLVGLKLSRTHEECERSGVLLGCLASPLEFAGAMLGGSAFFLLLLCPFVTLYYLYKGDYGYELLGLTTCILLQFALIPRQARWTQSVVPILGVSAYSFLLFLLFHLCSDSMLSTKSVLHIELLASAWLSSLKHPFGARYPHVSLAWIFIALFLASVFLESARTSAKILHGSKSLKTLLSRIKVALLVFTSVSLVAAQTDQLGLRKERREIREAKARSRAAEKMQELAYRLSPQERFTLLMSLEDLSERERSDEVGEESVRGLGYPSDDDRDTNIINGGTGDLALPETVAERISAEQAATVKRDALAKALQTLVDEESAAGFHVILPTVSHVADVLVSAVLLTLGFHHPGRDSVSVGPSRRKSSSCDGDRAWRCWILDR